MISLLKKFIEQTSQPGKSTKRSSLPEHDIRLASAALLIETAKSDFQFDQIEQDKLKEILKRVYGLKTEHLNELVRQAKGQVEHAVSLDQFSKVLDENLSPTQKVDFLQQLWEVAFADGHIDKYEEYLIRKLADLLHVPHKGYITAKLRAENKVER